MSDYERYGDYNDIEEDAPKSKSPVMLILKILIAVVCVGVVGLLAFRLIIFNAYPDSVKNIFFNEKLTAYYNEHSGNIGAKTQDIYAPYDDNEEGNFFCDHLVVIEGAEQLQITVRYNTGNLERISEQVGIALDDNDPSIFEFRLVDNYERVYTNIGGSAFDKMFNYRYQKLVFDDVKFDYADGTHPEWIRLEVFVKGYDSEEPYAMICIYENNERYSEFSDYKLSSKETP